jgi:hypothetical protein
MTLLADGVGRLDSARGIAWVQLSNGARNAVLKSVEGSEFFTTIRMATINNLYTNPWSIASSAATSLLRTCILLALVQRRRCTRVQRSSRRSQRSGGQLSS